MFLALGFKENKQLQKQPRKAHPGIRLQEYEYDVISIERFQSKMFSWRNHDGTAMEWGTSKEEISRMQRAISQKLFQPD